MKMESKQDKAILWNKDYNRVMFANFALYFSFYLLTPLLPLYLSETFHSSKDTIGLVLSGYTLVALLMRPFSGFMVDAFSRKKVLLVCLFVYFLFFGGYLVAGSLLVFAIFRTLHGGPYGATTVANSTMAIDVLHPSRRNEGIGFYGLSNNLGSALAPMLGIYIYNYVHDFDLLFWIAFIVAGIGFANTCFVHPHIRQVKRTGKKISLDRFFLKRGWFLAMTIVFFGFCWGVMSNYLAIYGKEHLGTTNSTGTFFLILSLCLMASRITGRKSLREGRLINNATIGILLSTVGYFIFIAWPTTVWGNSTLGEYLGMIGYFASAVLVGFGNGHMWPAFQNMIISIAHHDERGTANSTILTSWDIGLGLGVFVGGTVAEYFGFDTTFWLMAGIHIIGMLSYMLIVRPCYKSALKSIA